MSHLNGTCALQMPSSYVLMDEEEMMYVDGGYSLPMERRYLNKSVCTGMSSYYCSVTGLQASVIAKEIFAHAFLYYAAGLYAVSAGVSAASTFGDILLKGATLVACNYIRSHAEVIDLGSGTFGQADSRQWLFNIIWAAC
ncbi:MAG: hypothetical protein VB035_14555 [Candidatus Fimivivens sp.]|nr:hypothetical protein [Candidatus Fimivivens sp.]